MAKCECCGERETMKGFNLCNPCADEFPLTIEEL